MSDNKIIYKGKNKHIYTTEKDEYVILKFLDNESYFDGDIKARFKNKGNYRNNISDIIFNFLGSYNIPTHLNKKISDNEMNVKKLSMLPFIVVIRNLVAGSLAKRFRLKEGDPLKYPVLEYYLKNEELNKPMISESHAYAFEYATPDELKYINRIALKTNAVLKTFFDRRQLVLADYKLEFGRYRNQICLGDEISPDTCRIWAMNGEKADRKLLAFGDGKADKAYKEILNRLH